MIGLHPDKEVLIGVRDTEEKLLVKSEEYTSPINKIYKVEQEYIIITENLFMLSLLIFQPRVS